MQTTEFGNSNLETGLKSPLLPRRFYHSDFGPSGKANVDTDEVRIDEVIRRLHNQCMTHKLTLNFTLRKHDSNLKKENAMNVT
jgi:hypothetical protein